MKKINKNKTTYCFVNNNRILTLNLNIEKDNDNCILRKIFRKGKYLNENKY